MQPHLSSDSRNVKKVLLTAFSPAGEKSEEWDVYQYLKRSGVSDITAFYWGGVEVKAKIPPDVKAIEISGDGDFETKDIEQYDLIFRHATTRPGLLLPSGVEITSMTREFFKNCQAPIIGVTGTKGKGTTSTLISRILENSGLKTHLTGNIGVPALQKLTDIKAQDIVVFELSSYKLWDMKQSPHIAVVLMVEPEHLDVHSDVDDYIQAKTNIARWQGEADVVIYHPSNELSAKIANVGIGQKLKYLSPQGANIKDGQLVIEEQIICAVEDFGLLGKHNHENIAAAVTAAWRYTQDTTAIAKAIKEFKGLEHRLQQVAVKHGVVYIDDSFGTTPATAVAAVKSFAQPKVLILGGSDKGSDFHDLGQAVADSNVKRALLIGQMAKKIAAELDKVGYSQYELVTGSMADVVARAAEVSQEGDVVLLSPACASFDMFKDYIDRAEQFRTAAEAL